MPEEETPVSPPTGPSKKSYIRMTIVITAVALIYIFGVKSCSERREREGLALGKSLSEAFIEAIGSTVTDSTDMQIAHAIVDSVMEALRHKRIGRKEAMALAAKFQHLSFKDSITTDDLMQLKHLTDTTIRAHSLADSLE